LPVGAGVAVSRNGRLVLRQIKSVLVAADDGGVNLEKVGQVLSPTARVRSIEIIAYA